MEKRYYIKIPKVISVYYSGKNNFLVIRGPLMECYLRLTLKVNVLYRTNLLKITRVTAKKTSRNKKKILRSLQGQCHSQIKQTVLNSASRLCKKLKFVGVGYKAFLLEKPYFNVLQLRLGFSHDIFIKFPTSICIQCFKTNAKIYILGNLYQKVLEITSTIRSYKKPEPYKGKGILYLTEDIILKEGKKL